MLRKRFLGSLFPVLLLLPAVGQAQASVRVSADGRLPVPMIGVAACLSPAGKLETVGGFTGRRSLTEIYVRSNGRWTTAAHLPRPTHDAAAGYLNGSLFIFGGGQAYSTRDLLRVQGTHTVHVAYLGHPLSDAVTRPYRLHGVDGLIMVGGHGGPDVRKVYFISGTNNGHTRWRTLFSLPIGVRYTAVAVEGSKVYIAGGLSAHGRIDSAWSWQPGQASPHRLPSLPRPMEKAAAFAWQGTVYVVGGLGNGGRTSADILAYHAGQGGWRRVGRLPGPLADMGYVQHGRNGYLLGGMSGPSSHSAGRRVWHLRFE
ncbi:hypothetical protein [Acidihalobacter prosperus]